MNKTIFSAPLMILFLGSTSTNIDPASNTVNADSIKDQPSEIIEAKGGTATRHQHSGESCNKSDPS